MTVVFFELLTTLFIVNISVLCAERRLWSLADDSKYSYFDDRRRQEMLEATRHMFYFGYDSYMTHAFPKDELDPIHCTGRGPDYDNPYAKIIAPNTGHRYNAEVGMCDANPKATDTRPVVTAVIMGVFLAAVVTAITMGVVF